MKQKLLNLVNKIHFPHFVSGLLIGYFGHGVIHTGVDWAMALAKLVLKV